MMSYVQTFDTGYTSDADILRLFTFHFLTVSNPCISDNYRFFTCISAHLCVVILMGRIDPFKDE